MSESKDLKLSGLLKEKLINLELKTNNKPDLLEELVNFIAKAAKVKNKKTLLKIVKERESLGSTGIGGGIALPHIKYKDAKKFVLAFARKKEGIDFKALDGEKTYLFFVLISPAEQVGSHLKILAEISRLVRDKFIVDQLKSAKNAKEVLKIVSLSKG
ncbi:MAG: PTS sugar transporter subunit IIA [Candidatus Omnitrophica bacterium]|nr:PTS sugar transporter subunit IIA [Candidatus Omnitrophota bacterium]